MTRKIKKVIASLIAVSCLSTCAMSFSTSAYWTTQSFANGNATGYNSVSSTSVYAYTNSTLTNVNRSVYIEHINYNAEPMRSPYFKSSTTGKVIVGVSGSDIFYAKTIHHLDGFDNKTIAMNA